MFDGISIDSIYNYVKDKGINTTLRDVKLYLVSRSLREDYKNGYLYKNNRMGLDKVDYALSELTEGVYSFSQKNPRVIMTDFIINLFSDLKDCTLYFFDYDTITLEIHYVNHVFNFINKLKEFISSSELSHIPYRFIVGNSLLDNLKNIESEGVLVNPNGGFDFE